MTDVDMDQKIKLFEIKVNAFIEKLQETGESVFSQDNKIQRLLSKVDNEISEKNELLNKIEFLKTERDEINTKYEEKIQLLEEEISRLKVDNEKIKSETISKIDESQIVKVDSSEIVEEIEEISILNHFHPSYWDGLIELSERNKLTLPILSALLEMNEAHLIIIALKLEVEHSHCLEVINELKSMGIIELKQKKEGELNPLIRLKEHI